MSASQEQKVDYLLKKIGYVSSKTGIAEDSSLSGTKKAPFAEPISSPLVVPSSFVWSDSSFIPTTPPGSTGTYVEVYATASAYQMTVDTTVSGNRTFIARATAGDSSSAIEGDWIDPSFGASYVIKVYKGDPNSGGALLPAAGSGSNDTWFFDYSSGVLNFNGTSVPSGVTSTNIYLVGYRYIGAKGIQPPAGIATFNDLHVSGITTLGTVQITSSSSGGIVTALSGVVTYYGDGSNLTGISTDSDKLQGQNGSYYLDYNNFTGTPTIPTVNDATLTLATSGDGILGSDTFTANQASNTTFTVTVSSASTNQANTLVYRDASGGFSAGVVTATTFSGSGAGLTSIPNSSLTTSSVSYGGVSLALGSTDATPAFDLSDATNYPTSSLSGTITNAQLAGSIANDKLSNFSVSYGGVSLALGASDPTPAFNLSDATSYPYASLTGITTNIIGDTTPQLGGNLDANSKDISGVNNLNVSGVSTFTGDVSFGSTVTFGDNDQILMGDGDDLKIYHSGTNSIISDNGNGALDLRTNGGSVRIRTTGLEEIAQFNKNGSVDLYYDNSLKFQTTGIGVSVANGAGNTAYIEGPSEIWIDPHPAGVGATSGAVRIRGDLYVDGTEFIVDVDKIELGDFNVGIASTVGTNALLDGAGIGIGSTNIRKTITWNNATSALMSSENWNLASGKHYEINGTDVLTSTTLGSGVVNSSLTSVGTLGSLTVTNDITANGNIVGDNSTNISGISSVTATTFYGSGANLTNVDAATLDGVDSTSFLRSDAFDIKTSGNLTFNDSIQARFGTSGDMSISHDGTDNHITSSYDKDLNIEVSPDGGTPKIYIRPTTSHQGITLGGGSGNPVELYHTNVKKFQTTGIGVTVYGTTETQQLNVSGVVTATTFSGSGSSLTGLTGASAATYGSATIAPVITVDANGRITGITTATISGGGGGTPGGSDGQIQYNNGGSFGGAAQLYYDDVNNRLGLNASSPAYTFDLGESASTIRLVSESGGTAIRIGSGGNNDYTIFRIGSNDGESDSANYGYSFRYLGSGTGNNNKLQILSDNQEGTAVQAFTMLQDGKIGIANTTPSTELEVGGTITATNYTGKIYIDESEDDDANHNLVFIDAAYSSGDQGNSHLDLEIDSGGITFNPSTNTLTVPNIAGIATGATRVYIDESEDDDAEHNLVFIDAAYSSGDQGNSHLDLEIDSGAITFNPSTNTLTVPNIAASLTGVASSATKVYVDESEDDNANYHVMFSDVAPGGGNEYRTLQVDTNGIQFNPFSNDLKINGPTGSVAIGTNRNTNIEASLEIDTGSLVGTAYTNAMILDHNGNIRVTSAEPTIEIIGSDGGNHAASIYMRNLNEGYAFINNPTTEELEIKSFTASANDFHATGANGSNLSSLNKILRIGKDGTIGISTGSILAFDGPTTTGAFYHASNADTTLLRVTSDGSTANLSGDYGFTLKYLGSGTGNNNKLQILSDNQTAGTQVQAFTMLQDGKIGINDTSPSSELEVGGTITATSFVKTGGTSSQYLMADGSTSTGGGGGGSGVASTITVADESSDTTCFPVFSTAATGDVNPKTGSNLTFNSSNGTLTATEFSGGGSNLTGVLKNVVEDTTPQLGGNLDLNSKNITGTGDVNVTGIVTVTSTDAGSGAGPFIDLYRNSASPSNNDTLGKIRFYGENDNDEKILYSSIYAYAGDETDGTEDARLYLDVISAGSDSNRIMLQGGGNTKFMNKNVTLTTGVDLVFEGASSNAHETTLTVTDPTQDNTITLPDSTGTVLLTDGSGANLTNVNAATLDSIDSGSFLRSDAADTKTSGNLTFNDSIQARFGNNSDLRISHDGTDNHIMSADKDLSIELSPDAATPKLYLRPTTSHQGITLGGGSGNPVELYHSNAKKFETTGVGVTVTGDLIVSNNARITGILTVGSSSITLDGSDNSIHGFDTLIAPPKRADTVNISVTVGSKTTANRYYDQGSGSCYFLNGVEAPFLTLTPGRTYRFTLSSSDMTNHPFRLYLEADKTTAYTTNVTSTATYTEIVVNDATPSVLHYQCSAHSLMGNSVQTNSSVPVGSGANLTGVLSDVVEDTTPQLGGNLDLNSKNITGIGTIDVTGDLLLTSTDAGSAAGPIIELYRNSASPAVNDTIGAIRFYGENDADEKFLYAQINGRANDETDGTEDGRLDFYVAEDGSQWSGRLVLAGNSSTKFVNKNVLLGQGVNLIFEGASDNTNETTLTVTDPTQDNTITLPDTTGTVLLTDGSASSLTDRTGASAATYGNSTTTPVITVDANGRITTIGTATISGGGGGGGGVASTITVADESSDTTCFPIFSTAATGDVNPKTGSNLTFDSSNGRLTATSVSVGSTTNIIRKVTDVNSWVAADSDTSFNVTNEQNNPTGLYFKSDGTKMFVTGTQAPRDVEEYALSSAWDITTASHTTAYSLASQDTAPQGLYFSPNGQNMFVAGNSTDSILHYTLSTGWDLSSTINYEGNFSVSSQATLPTGVTFGDSGTKMYVVGRTNDSIHQYNLSSAYTITSGVTHAHTLDIGQSSSIIGTPNGFQNPHGISISSDGTKIWIIGSNEDIIAQFNLGTAYDLSTATYNGDLTNIFWASIAAYDFYIDESAGKGFVLFVGTNDSVREIDITNPGLLIEANPTSRSANINLNNNVQVKGRTWFEDTIVVNGTQTSYFQHSVNVQGSITCRGVIDLADGSADRIQFGATDDAKIYYDGTDNYFDLQFSTADNNGFRILNSSDSELFRVAKDGKVGINSTTPTADLDVNGHANVSGVITATSFSGSGSSLTGLTGASAATYGDATNSAQITVDANGRITGISEVSISGGGGGSGSTTRSVNRYVATNNQTLFPPSGTVSYTVGYIDVYLNGSKLDSTEFTASNGTTITLTTGASANDIVELVAYTSIDVTNVTVVNDTSPQLGGDLDLNGNDITGTGNINITGTATVTGGQVATQNDAIAFAIALG